MSAPESADRGGRSAPITPLYKRLPHGPHGMEREQIVRNQRARMFGAMIQAVSEYGYCKTGVKHVIGLAGVSRRAFYEQFPNKEACFLATFDGIVAQAVVETRQAYAELEQDPQTGLLTVLELLLKMVREDPARARLVARDSPIAGPGGLEKFDKLMRFLGQKLGGHLAGSADDGEISAALLRAVIGSLYGVVLLGLREDDLAEVSAEDLHSLVRLGVRPLGDLHGQTRPVITREMPDPPLEEQARREIDKSTDVRTRMLLGALVVGMTEGAHDASQVAHMAGVSLDCFFETFKGVEQCFSDGLQMLSYRLFELIATTESGDPQWARSVHDSLTALTSYLVEHPLYAQALTLETATPQTLAVDRGLDVARGLAILLTEGAPPQASSKHAIDAIAGAIWHTVSCHVKSRKLHRLPTVSDQLTYFVLGVCLDAEQAAAELESVSEGQKQMGSRELEDHHEVPVNV